MCAIVCNTKWIRIKRASLFLLKEIKHAFTVRLTMIISYWAFFPPTQFLLFLILECQNDSESYSVLKWHSASHNIIWWKKWDNMQQQLGLSFPRRLLLDLPFVPMYKCDMSVLKYILLNHEPALCVRNHTEIFGETRWGQGFWHHQAIV